MTAPNTPIRDAMLREGPSGLVLPLPSPMLAQLPERLQGKPMQWYVNPVNVLAVAATKSAPGSFQTDRTHAFAAWFGVVSIRSSDDQTDHPTDPATVSMTDSQNNQYNPQAFPIYLTSAFGLTASLPAVWPAPLVVDPNNGINLNVTNLHAANTNNYRFAFIGQLITV